MKESPLASTQLEVVNSKQPTPVTQEYGRVRSLLKNLISVGTFFLPKSLTRGSTMPQDAPMDPQKNLQQETWENAQPAHDRLLPLEDPQNSAEQVIPGFSTAFLTDKELMSGKVTVCVCCMDERVPGPKIGVAGAAVLMTDISSIQEKVKTMSDEEIYAWLSDPASGDKDFRSYVAHLLKLGWKYSVADHAGCGAVGIFCAKFKELTGHTLKPERVAAAAAKRLHIALGLEGEHQTADYSKKKINMDGHPEIHDGYCVIIDGTGRLNTANLPVRGLLISARHAPSIEYFRVEAGAAKGILSGSHGLGNSLPRVPYLLIGDPDNPKFSVDALKEMLGPVLDPANTRILRATGPRAKAA